MKGIAGCAVVAAVSLAAVGCRAGVNPAPVAGATAHACNAQVAAADVSAWKSVEADGFTFCVPPDWSVGGSGRSWSRGTAKVTWGLGQTVAAADVPAMAQASRPAFACTGPSKGARIHPRPEMIGGRQAQVWRSPVRQGFYTGGHWSAPHFYIVGEASDAATADLEMAIVRTVRVASR